MRLFILTLMVSIQALAAVDEFSQYIQSAADNTQSMKVRWQALLTAASVAKADQIDAIKSFAKHDEWYMRNATLIALKKVSMAAAIDEARNLLKDRALVVRSAAVDIMAEDLTEDNKQLLIGELNKPYNFNKKSSLWIRKQIIEKITAIAQQKDKAFFARNLFDSDKEVAELSAHALEKITGRQVTDAKFVEKWQGIVKDNNWL